MFEDIDLNLAIIQLIAIVFSISSISWIYYKYFTNNEEEKTLYHKLIMLFLLCEFLYCIAALPSILIFIANPI